MRGNKLLFTVRWEYDMRGLKGRMTEACRVSGDECNEGRLLRRRRRCLDGRHETEGATTRASHGWSPR